jgi:hypothetical protein
LGKGAQKRIVAAASTALAAWASSRPAGSMRDDAKEALLRGASSVAATAASWRRGPYAATC